MADCLESLLQETSLSHNQKDEKNTNISSEKLLSESKDENSNLLKMYRKINAKKRSKKLIKKKIEIKPKLSMKDVLKSIDTKRVSNINKKLDPIAQRSKVTKRPPTKTISSRALRIAASTNTNKAVSKWEDFVQTNRRARFLSFEEPKINPIATTQDMANNFRPNSTLEKQLFGVVRDNVNSIDFDDTEFSLAERRALEKLSLEDAKQRRTELKRFRILLSKYEAKCKREKRIKSKNFHRLKRKEKFKDTGFVQSSEEIDRMRARERVTLKHAQGSKWVRRLNKINFNDRNARKLLHHQKEMGRELKKHSISQNTIDSDSDNEPLNESATIPWSSQLKGLELAFESSRQHQEPHTNANAELPEVDMHEFNFEDVPANFAFDNIIGDFAEEKENQLKEDNDSDNGLPGWGQWANKDGNIRREKKLSKKKTQKSKPTNSSQKQKSNQPLVIINEERKEELRKHQVLQVPFPFRNQDHFENALNNPTGREWNTERKFIDKTKPKVSIPTGQIIPPAKREFHKAKS